MNNTAYSNGAFLARHSLGLSKLAIAVEGPRISKEEAQTLGKRMHVDFDKYPFEGFQQGTETEFEHTSNPREAAKTSLDHLKEHPRYYTELKKMEKKLESEK